MKIWCSSAILYTAFCILFKLMFIETIWYKGWWRWFVCWWMNGAIFPQILMYWRNLNWNWSKLIERMDESIPWQKESLILDGSSTSFSAASRNCCEQNFSVQSNSRQNLVYIHLHRMYFWCRFSLLNHDKWPLSPRNYAQERPRTTATPFFWLQIIPLTKWAC